MIPVLAIIGSLCLWLMFRKTPGGKHHYRSNTDTKAGEPAYYSESENNFEPGGKFYQPEQTDRLSLNEQIRIEKEKADL